jgi:hypothetical protein
MRPSAGVAYAKINHYAQDRIARFVAKAQPGLRADGRHLPTHSGMVGRATKAWECPEAGFGD